MAKDTLTFTVLTNPLVDAKLGKNYPMLERFIYWCIETFLDVWGTQLSGMHPNLYAPNQKIVVIKNATVPVDFVIDLSKPFGFFPKGFGGYHTKGTNAPVALINFQMCINRMGAPFGFFFHGRPAFYLRKVLKMAGVPPHPATGSLTQMISHEIYEMLGNPYIDTWYYLAIKNLSTMAEVCDPVEHDLMTVTLDTTHIAAQNFVKPAWFGLGLEADTVYPPNAVQLAPMVCGVGGRSTTRVGK